MKYRIRGLLAASTMAAGSFVSCDSGGAFPPEPVSIDCPAAAHQGQAITLVVGARANSPAPGLPDEVKGLIREAAKSSKKVQVVRVDGQPTVGLTAAFRTNGNNSTIRERDLQSFLNQADGYVQTLKPKRPQADVLTALTVAARSTPEGGTIVLIDSGIPTTGPLSFTNSEMFTADPKEVVDFLDAQKLMPDLTKRSVVLVGLGDTADPQPALPENLHKQITDLWTTIADKAGADCVNPLKSATSRTSVPTDVPVTVVALPKQPVFPECGTTVLTDSSPVGFTLNTADFRDPKGARTTLAQLAKRMAGHSQRVQLVGTTSSEGSDASNQRLSERRADAVKDVLIDLGVAQSRISASGAGEHYPGRVRDTTAAGTLIPGAAVRNRSVVVKLSCDG
ncbi:OmpA family protein [Actinoplanes sp. KI2]|uniref:OmpA family protein n=1 Tax=Actinoplanes sp. KI2 TaxID=2983315 RepID=UPI0021D58F10|nr:OmpA family protein [Actinoplanes sp. KI2]MCU7728857.1 OmpA family protein [Actinoplanes sp. KI2]